jgi:hypothetical protein
MDINGYWKNLKKSNFFIIRPDPQSMQPDIEEFKTEAEMEHYLNGCSNPEMCIPVQKLDVEYKIVRRK